MEIITNNIPIELETLIQNEYSKYQIELYNDATNKRINHLNIYHKDWINNHCDNMINLLTKYYNINPELIISLGFITSHVNCHNQHFHIDYLGTTQTYFIPLVALTNQNGTEYLEFKDTNQNINLFNELVDISDKYIEREQIHNHFEHININKSDYDFKILNANKYSMVKMPYYLLHRGKQNETSSSRTMFQIVIKNVNITNINVKISTDVKINDSELDEEQHIIDKLLNSRKKIDI